MPYLTGSALYLPCFYSLVVKAASHSDQVVLKIECFYLDVAIQRGLGQSASEELFIIGCHHFLWLMDKENTLRTPTLQPTLPMVYSTI